MKLRKRALVPLIVPFLIFILFTIYLIVRLCITYFNPPAEETPETPSEEVAVVEMIEGSEF